MDSNVELHHHHHRDYSSGWALASSALNLPLVICYISLFMQVISVNPHPSSKYRKMDGNVGYKTWYVSTQPSGPNPKGALVEYLEGMFLDSKRGTQETTKNLFLYSLFKHRISNKWIQIGSFARDMLRTKITAMFKSVLNLKELSSVSCVAINSRIIAQLCWWSERMRSEIAVIYFLVLFHHLLEEAEVNLSPK